MIYLDTSVVLAQLLAEDRVPPESLWSEPLVSSRLLQHEVWTRIHSRGLAASHGALVRSLLDRIAFLEMVGPVLEESLHGFSLPLRTLDALHLASARFLQNQGSPVELATYDQRLLAAARAAEVPVRSL